VLPGPLKANDHLVGVALGIHAPAPGRLLHLLTMLVGAGEEKGLYTAQPGIAGQHIGQDGGVGMAQVGLVVDVVDGGGIRFDSPSSLCYTCTTTAYCYGRGVPKPGREGHKGESRSKSGAVPQL